MDELLDRSALIHQTVASSGSMVNADWLHGSDEVLDQLKRRRHSSLE
ncbi:MAG TPA: hypothetical protein VML01_00015 [Bryobacterales bacterium]|nr:hypothetical protein [Bryobacterales bacterium]